jgi:hypothetical protein
MRTTGLALLATLALAGCGGCGGNPGTCNGGALVCGGVDPTPSPDPGSGRAVGLFKGSTDTGRTAYTLVLASGKIWVLYGASGDASLLGGAENGNYTAADGEITSVDLVDFSAASGAVVRGSLQGIYAGEESIAATVTAGGPLASLAGTWDPNSADAAELADAVGTYDGTLSVTDGSDGASVAVSASGAITGTSTGGCTITGSLLPNSSAHSYSLNVNLAGGICGNEGITMAGVAIVEGTRIFGAGFNGIRSEGFTFAGGR